MRQARRVEAERILPLASAREPSRFKTDLYYCLALVVGAATTLAATITFLAMSPGSLAGPIDLVGARWVLAALGTLTGVLAFFSARLFLRRSAALARRLSIGPSGITFRARSRHRDQARAIDEQLLDFSRSFGMTLLSDRHRNRLVLAVTASERAVYFSAPVTNPEKHAYRNLLSQACTVSDDDAVLDAMGPDGIPLELRLRDLGVLVAMLLRADGRAFERCFLSDTQGAPVVLDNHELHVGKKDFDLLAPLEWRAMFFQEPFGATMSMSEVESSTSPPGGVMVYQGTWVRQGISEAILVSLIPSLSSVSIPPPPPVGGVPEVEFAILRDMRLMQALPEPPPPVELRVAIERMFMPRLRAALDRAPRASHKDIPSGAAAL